MKRFLILIVPTLLLWGCASGPCKDGEKQTFVGFVPATRRYVGCAEGCCREKNPRPCVCSSRCPCTEKHR